MKDKFSNLLADLGEAQLAFLLWLAALEDGILLKQRNSQHHEMFSQVKTCCLFIGYPRSGHSLISSLIDAHPNALISHRLDALQHFEDGLALNDIFLLMLQNSQRFARRGRKLTRYQYHIPGQWQGRFRVLHTIGDQEGRLTTERLGNNPDLLDDLMNIPQARMKFIHVVRNPFDNISSWAARTKQSLEATTGRYFELCKTVRSIKQNLVSGHLLEIHHAAFLGNPKAKLKALCQFLDLDPEPGYVEACVAIVYPQPHRTRHYHKWPADLVNFVEDEMKQFDFLEAYTFHD